MSLRRFLNRFIGSGSGRIEEGVDRLIEGEWSVDDLIEACVDEVSTAGSAGSGLDRPLGGDRIGAGAQAPVSTKKRKQQQNERLLQRFSEWRRRTGSEDVAAFLEAYAPNLTPLQLRHFRRVVMKGLAG